MEENCDWILRRGPDIVGIRRAELDTIIGTSTAALATVVRKLASVEGKTILHTASSLFYRKGVEKQRNILQPKERDVTRCQDAL